MPNSCLKRRMLFACEQTYNPGSLIADRAVDWQSGPEHVSRRDPDFHQAIDFALVGRIPQGVLVALRGTLPPFTVDDHDSPAVVRDWANNAEFLATGTADYGGLVHAGFAGSVARLWSPDAAGPGLEQRINSLLGDGMGPRALFITGHSKGGALANLVAFRARRKAGWADVPIRAFTIAAARAGDGAFRQAYEASGIVCLRYEDALDIVPFLPPGLDMPAVVRETARSIWRQLADSNYEPVGRRMLPALSWGEWLGAWLRRIRLLFGPGGLDRFKNAAMNAHLLGPGSAYDALVCDGEPGCTHS